ncbi:hypothetical protein PoB_003810300 [Plakobranchus ocellatus]|uniref:Secreted protein n=1 Tax=Plakobranchus ocellatus TaxID=259542 RepID=A0AAV4AXK8_9GAST|nr:hypothetical protein PoB_003810300 [Plakobranchus ocellatus]
MPRRWNFHIILAAVIIELHLRARGFRRRLIRPPSAGHRPTPSTRIKHAEPSLFDPHKDVHAVVADQPCRNRSARSSLCFALARKICTASLLCRCVSNHLLCTRHRTGEGDRH